MFDEISNIGFIKLPYFQNLEQKPRYPYNFEIGGRIHGKKFAELLKIVLEEDNQKILSDMINELFDTHRLQSQLLQLSVDELAEFLIHTLYANHEKLDWNTIKSLETTLLRRYIPRWEIPSLDFKDDLSSLLSTMIEFNPDYDLIVVLKEISDKSEGLNSEKLYIDRIKRSVNRKRINLGDFLILYGNLRLIRDRAIIEFPKYHQVLDHLEDVSQTLIKENKFVKTEHSIIFTSIFINLYLEDRRGTIEYCQNKLSTMDNTLESLDEDQQRSYSWIIDGVRANIGRYLIKFEMESITEDILLRSLSNRLLYPENIDLKRWRLTIVTSEVNPWIFSILLDGYVGMYKLQQNYESQLYNKDLNKLKMINQFIEVMLEDYIVKIANKKGSENMIQGLNLDLFPLFMIEEIIETYSHILFQKFILDDLERPANEIVQIHDQITNLSVSELYFKIDQINMRILADQYNFDSMVEEILADYAERTLMESHVFEDEVIRIYANVFHLSQNITMNADIVPAELYKKLLFFLGEWFSVLMRHEQLQQNLLIMILPFIKICHRMIERYFDNHRLITQANLLYLNGYLLELYLASRYGIPNFEELSQIRDKNKLIESFYNVLKEFNIEEKFDVEQIKIFAMGRQITETADIRTTTTAKVGEKFSGENMINYMDISDKLDDFLLKLARANKEELVSMLHSTLFPELDDNPEILDLIGTTQARKGFETVVFPYIKNIRYVATALAFFPIDIDLQNFTIDTIL